MTRPEDRPDFPVPPPGTLWVVLALLFVLFVAFGCAGPRDTGYWSGVSDGVGVILR